MASNTESHADIIEEMRGNYYKIGGSNARLDKDLMGLMSFTANRLEAAHKREVEKLVANLDALEKAVERVCSRDVVNEIAAVKKQIQERR